MIKLNDLVKCIEIIAPLDIQEEWDNSGMQISPATCEINSILLALEITKDVISEAREKGVDMIITHHPLFFNPLKNIFIDDVVGAQVISLLEGKRIGLYSAHTSFDSAPQGLNEKLASLLEMQVLPFGPPNYMRLGSPKQKMKLSEMILHIKKSLKIQDPLRFQGSKDAVIGKVMLCCGGGGDFITMAKKEGCDLYITSDIKQHEWRIAEELDIALIDAGHYYTERPFAEAFAKLLKESIVEQGLISADEASKMLLISKSIKDPYQVL